MALAQISSSLSLSVRGTLYAYAFSSPKTSSATPRLPLSKLSLYGSVFATGSPLLIRQTCYQKQPAGKAMLLPIRCEQGTQDNSSDVWLGRFAMIGFAVAITVEVTTGKGLLENFGLTSPLPTVALAVTAFVGILTAVFIFQSASKD
ncbi:stress enhanced protein 1, chloroplastic-like isoform X1 [Castanea sativa]|uniref:stress enhanced protein 1, chloroplastic-like isoform X1 n=1 Tax=Castanea sativa TaxID=21020 RepID=UPI003F649652